MGNSSSSNTNANTQPKSSNPVENNIQKLIVDNNKDNQKTTDIVETLNDLTEIHTQKGGSLKKQIPLLSNNETNSYETSENIIGGFENTTGRKRYTKYDLFKILRNLDLETEINQEGGNENTDSSLNDDQSMEHIKNIILKELETLKNNKSQQLGGSGCGCAGSNDSNGVNGSNSKKLNSKLNLNNIIVDDDNDKQVGGTIIIDGSSSSSDTSTSTNSSSSEFGKSKKSAKSKSSKSKSKSKYNKRQESSSESSKFVIETSESGKESVSSVENKQTSNGEDSEEGLSIFPFNSSDVKSSLSIKNYRMLRRKI